MNIPNTSGITIRPDLSIPWRIPSTLNKKGIALSSLRPGDWMRMEFARAYVVQNSAKLKRIEVAVYNRHRFVSARVFDYSTLSLSNTATYYGQGKFRAWLRFVPSFLRNRFASYSQP